MAFAQVRAIHGFIDRLPVRYLLVRFEVVLVPRTTSSSLCSFRHVFHDLVHDPGVAGESGRAGTGSKRATRMCVVCLISFSFLLLLLEQQVSQTHLVCTLQVFMID